MWWGRRERCQLFGCQNVQNVVTGRWRCAKGEGDVKETEDGA